MVSEFITFSPLYFLAISLFNTYLHVVYYSGGLAIGKVERYQNLWLMGFTQLKAVRFTTNDPFTVLSPLCARMMVKICQKHQGQKGYSFYCCWDFCLVLFLFVLFRKHLITKSQTWISKRQKPHKPPILWLVYEPLCCGLEAFLPPWPYSPGVCKTRGMALSL